MATPASVMCSAVMLTTTPCRTVVPVRAATGDTARGPVPAPPPDATARRRRSYSPRPPAAPSQRPAPAAVVTPPIPPAPRPAGARARTLRSDWRASAPSNVVVSSLRLALRLIRGLRSPFAPGHERREADHPAHERQEH